jgi:hypothetical protein
VTVTAVPVNAVPIVPVNVLPIVICAIVITTVAVAVVVAMTAGVVVLHHIPQHVYQRGHAFGQPHRQLRPLSPDHGDRSAQRTPAARGRYVLLGVGLRRPALCPRLHVAHGGAQQGVEQESQLFDDPPALVIGSAGAR